MKKTLCTSSLFLCFTVCAIGQGTTLWDEGVNGQFSKDFNNPTSLLPLSMGTNTIIGATELQPTPPNYVSFPDYFVIHVPSDQSVIGLYLQIDRPNVWAWIGDANFQTPLSYSLNSSSGNLLSQLGLNSIGPGSYGMYLLNNDAEPILSIATYRLDFFVQSIPEPGTFALALTGAIGLAVWRRRGRGPRSGTGHRKNSDLNRSKRR